MRSDGIQRWEDAKLVVHAAYHAETLCGRWMDSERPARLSRPLRWMPVAHNLKVTCDGCAAVLKEKDHATHC